MKMCKKLLSLFIVVLFSLSFSVVGTGASDYVQDGITYSDTAVESECKITSISGSVRGSVIIPERVNGKKVVEVTADAFQNNLSITSVELPSTIKTVRAAAFKGCSALVTVKFNGPVDTFKDSVFSGCTSLLEVCLPENMNIIPKETFFGCLGLRSITIQPTVKTIGSSAFVNCKSLTEINIPKSVNLINSKAFLACTSLESITVEEGNASYKVINSALLTADGTELITYPCGLNQSVYTLPDGVTEIDYGAFAYSNLGKIILPSSVVNIGDYAFQYNEKLYSINIPEGTQTIGSHAFENCSRLKLISIPSTVVSYGNAFVGSGLTTLIIEDGSTSVSEHAFESCSQLKRVVIPDSVESIGIAAFYLCSGLESVIVPASVKEINTDAFKGCDEVLMYVEDNSYAMQYAIDNNIDYELYVGGTTEVGICVEKMPNKLLYSPGEELDITGMIVSVVYADGKTSPLSIDKYQLVCDDLDSSGAHNVNVSYKDFSDSFTVNVARLIGLKVNASGCKTTYHINEAFDKTGLIVNLEYSNGTMVSTDEYEVICPELDEKGTYSVKVTNGECSDYFDITVYSIKSIRVKALPAKTTYNYKESLNPSGIVIAAVYGDGKECELNDSEYRLSDTYFSKVGTATVQVTCGDYTTSFNVTVKYSFWQMLIRIVLFGFLWY